MLAPLLGSVAAFDAAWLSSPPEPPPSAEQPSLDALLRLVKHALPVLSMTVHELVRQIIACALDPAQHREGRPQRGPSGVAEAAAHGALLWKAWQGHLDFLSRLMAGLKEDEDLHASVMATAEANRSRVAAASAKAAGP